MLAQWLPYRSYDRKNEIFYQTNSIGFTLEVAPLVGADERTGEILAQFLSEGLPPASRVQILAFQSPRVGQTIARYALPRFAAGFLAARPKLLVADEPTGDLDKPSAAAILALMRQLVEEHGRTVIMVTHEADIAAHARRVVVLRDGVIHSDDKRDAFAAKVGL